VFRACCPRDGLRHCSLSSCPALSCDCGMKAVSKIPRFCAPTLSDYLALSTYGYDAGRYDARADRQSKMLAKARRKTGKPACFVFRRGLPCHATNVLSQHRHETPRAALFWFCCCVYGVLLCGIFSGFFERFYVVPARRQQAPAGLLYRRFDGLLKLDRWAAPIG